MGPALCQVTRNKGKIIPGVSLTQEVLGRSLTRDNSPVVTPGPPAGNWLASRVWRTLSKLWAGHCQEFQGVANMELLRFIQ